MHFLLGDRLRLSRGSISNDADSSSQIESLWNATGSSPICSRKRIVNPSEGVHWMPSSIGTALVDCSTCHYLNGYSRLDSPHCNYTVCSSLKVISDICCFVTLCRTGDALSSSRCTINTWLSNPSIDRVNCSLKQLFIMNRFFVSDI